MSEEANTGTSETTEVAPGNSPAKTAYDLKQSVAEAIIAGTPGIRGQVVEELAKEELTKRKELALKAVRKRDEVAREVDKLTRPPEKKFRIRKGGDGKSLIADGRHMTEEVEVFLDSKQVKELSDKQAELNKLDKALAAAFAPEKPDYSLLKNLSLN